MYKAGNQIVRVTTVHLDVKAPVPAVVPVDVSIETLGDESSKRDFTVNVQAENAAEIERTVPEPLSR